MQELGRFSDVPNPFRQPRTTKNNRDEASVVNTADAVTVNLPSALG